MTFVDILSLFILICWCLVSFAVVLMVGYVAYQLIKD